MRIAQGGYEESFCEQALAFVSACMTNLLCTASMVAPLIVHTNCTSQCATLMTKQPGTPHSADPCRNCKRGGPAEKGPTQGKK